MFNNNVFVYTIISISEKVKLKEQMTALVDKIDKNKGGNL
jgi:hypothetical protein